MFCEQTNTRSDNGYGKRICTDNLMTYHITYRTPVDSYAGLLGVKNIRQFVAGRDIAGRMSVDFRDPDSYL